MMLAPTDDRIELLSARHFEPLSSVQFSKAAFAPPVASNSEPASAPFVR